MKILLTCGVGDFIALESFLAFKETQSVEVIYWATRAREVLMPLIPFVFPNVKEHIIIKDDWAESFKTNFCIESIEELTIPDDVIDFSIKTIISSIIQGYRRHRGSFLEKTALTSISHLNLPDNYFVVHPYSENARSDDRDMSPQEWTSTWRNVRSTGCSIVIINKGGEKLKQYPNVIDLTDKLTLLESIEVTRHARGFIGASSVFSVVASKVMAPGQLFIKGHTLLKNEFAWFYYAPHDDPHTLVTQNLLKILPRLEKLVIFSGSTKNYLHILIRLISTFYAQILILFNSEAKHLQKCYQRSSQYLSQKFLIKHMLNLQKQIAK